MEATIKRPRRSSPLQYYQRTYYDTRVKATVDAEYKRLREAALSSGQTPPMHLPISNAVTQRLFEAESEDFRAQLLDEAEADFQQRVAEYRAALAKPSLPNSPEEYHRYMALIHRCLSGC